MILSLNFLLSNCVYICAAFVVSKKKGRRKLNWLAGVLGRHIYKHRWKRPPHQTHHANRPNGKFISVCMCTHSSSCSLLCVCHFSAKNISTKKRFVSFFPRWHQLFLISSGIDWNGTIVHYFIFLHRPSLSCRVGCIWNILDVKHSFPLIPSLFSIFCSLLCNIWTFCKIKYNSLLFRLFVNERVRICISISIG